MTAWTFGALKMFGYRLIVADPPWRFRLRCEETGSKKGPAAHYALMDLDAIKALRVADLAAPDCLLLLWCTGWLMATGKASAVASAWGFKPQTELVWIKTTVNGKRRMGPGYRARTLHEPVLLATLGNPKHAAFPSVFDGVAREHSRKPEEFYDLVDRLAPQLSPRADLFARTARPGWDAWGNEVGKFSANDGAAA